MKQMTALKHQSGLTLIELTLGIALVLVVIGIGILVYNGRQQSSHSYSGESGLLALVAGVKQINPNPSYTGLTTGVIISAKAAPSNMVNGTELVNDWGGAVTVAATNYNGGTGNAFAVTYESVPSSECNTLVNAVAPNFQVIIVGKTTVKNEAAGTYPTAATVATACVNGTNSVVFTQAG